MPHDDNIYESLSSTYKRSYGGDPGRDGVMFTGDDVDLQNVLNEMKNDKITLFNINSGGSWLQPFWKAWTGITGGDSIPLSDASQIPRLS